MSQWWVRRSSSAVVIFGVTEDARPFGEGEIGRQDDRGALVKPADQVEQHLAAADRKRQIAEFVEDDEIDADEVVGKAPRLSGLGFGLGSRLNECRKGFLGHVVPHPSTGAAIALKVPGRKGMERGAHRLLAGSAGHLRSPGLTTYEESAFLH
jgi:hypothetical protein